MIEGIKFINEDEAGILVSVSLKVATDSQEKCFHYIAN